MSCSTRRTAALATLSWRRPRTVSSVGRALPTGARAGRTTSPRSEEHTSELQSLPTRLSSDLLDAANRGAGHLELAAPADGQLGRQGPADGCPCWADNESQIGRAHV